MKSSILVKFFVGTACLFLALFFMGYILNWNNFDTVKEFIFLLLPFLAGGIVCLWCFGFTADHKDECVKLEEKVADKSRKIVENAMYKRHKTVVSYNILMNMPSKAHRDYYNYLRRAC